MKKISVRRIDETHAEDARLPNQPFQIWGRMIPCLEHGKWGYEVKKFEQIEEECFPDEPYDVVKDNAIFLGAYDEDICIGVGGILIESCMHEAEKLGMQGVYTIGQDNNLSACLFYLKQGFEIGGFDNRSYRGTSQEKSANIFFYKDIKNSQLSKK